MKKLKSIFRFKCPRCHQGEFLDTRNVYDLKKAGDLKENCSHCGLKYEREVGFYFGAMYVAYALAVALFVTCWVATTVLYPNYEAMTLVWIVIGASLLTGPILYALSKIIWINLFVHYDKQYEEKGKEAIAE